MGMVVGSYLSSSGVRAIVPASRPPPTMRATLPTSCETKTLALTPGSSQPSPRGAGKRHHVEAVLGDFAPPARTDRA